MPQRDSADSIEEIRRLLHRSLLHRIDELEKVRGDEPKSVESASSPDAETGSKGQNEESQAVVPPQRTSQQQASIRHGPEWVRCPKCRGEVGIPDNVAGRVHCPKCGELVYTVDPTTQVKWKPEPPPAPAAQPPPWMKFWGYVLTWFGVLVFVATVYIKWPKDSYPDGKEYFVAFLVGLLNPMVFIGLPLGLYWLSRSGELRRWTSPDGR